MQYSAQNEKIVYVNLPQSHVTNLKRLVLIINIMAQIFYYIDCPYGIILINYFLA